MEPVVARILLLAIVLFVVGQISILVAGDEQPKPELYTAQEKVALKQFRSHMKDVMKSHYNKNVIHEYMLTDEFLINWLRARNMDQAKAAEMLGKALEWRLNNRMDNILHEHYPLFEKNFPYLSDGIDRKGRSVLIFPIGAWDVRKVTVSGHRDEFMRFMEQIIERDFTKIHQNYGESNVRKNITQITVIYDLAGYNLRQHACIGCIPIYIRMIQNYEQYYPQGIHKIIGINTPPIFDALMQILRPFMSEHSRKALTLYGFNKEQWKGILLAEISPEQLPAQYGGSRKIVVR